MAHETAQDSPGDAQADEAGPEDDQTDEETDQRTQLEKIIEGHLIAAIHAMTIAAELLTTAELPWLDLKTVILCTRADSVLSDLDHMRVRVAEQPPQDETG